MTAVWTLGEDPATCIEVGHGARAVTLARRLYPCIPWTPPDEDLDPWTAARTGRWGAGIDGWLIVVTEQVGLWLTVDWFARDGWPVVDTWTADLAMIPGSRYPLGPDGEPWLARLVKTETTTIVPCAVDPLYGETRDLEPWRTRHPGVNWSGWNRPDGDWLVELIDRLTRYPVRHDMRVGAR